MLSLHDRKKSHSHLDVVRALCRIILLRDPTDANFPNFVRSLRGMSIDEIADMLLRSDEFAAKTDRFLEKHLRREQSISDLEFRCPTDLSVSSVGPRRVIVVGQCLFHQHPWAEVLKWMVPGCECDFFLFNRVQPLPAQPPAPVSEYDFQLIGIPLRSVLPETTYFRLSYSDVGAYERLFEESADRLRQYFAAAMQWNREHGLLTFVTNFALPQQNPVGRLLPRYDLRNFVHFVEKLNEVLAEEIRLCSNAYLFDFDQVIATFGRRYFQDDVVCVTGHNAHLFDFDFTRDKDRLEEPVRASVVYPGKQGHFVQLAWTELLAMYRTIRQTDMVKLVAVDIDDTLWRGVAVEKVEHFGDAIEGWPIGFAEALTHLKRRGILLALISKNEEKLVAPIWGRLYGETLPFEDFAVRKINWRPKAENLEEILAETNLLPRSVVYVDDNPAERAAIKSAFPEVRTFGPNPLVWRRILLWAPETQVSVITAESASRTAMVRAQVERETHRKKLTREEFLTSLNVELALREIGDAGHAEFPRALELLNKSNQFNTTGERWTNQQCVAAFLDGTRFFVFEVRDKFTNYGIVGVVICRGSHIAQFVMSCRVVGMEVEIGAIAELLRIMGERTGSATFTADLKETEVNLLARDLWEKCGFGADGDCWLRGNHPELQRPPHIRSSVTLAARSVPELVDS